MLDIIKHCNSITNSREANNILILYDQDYKMFIGDTYILVNKLASCRSFFSHASIDINCRNKAHTALCSTLLRNNPYIRDFNDTPWEELSFHNYDIVFCISRNEMPLIQILRRQYELLFPRPWVTAVYSMSVQFLNYGSDPVVSSILPPFMELLDDQAKHIIDAPPELYISREERNWANQWLRDNGLKDHEHLFVILDSTSERYKLMSMDTYQQMLVHLLNEESVKLLIFDEQNIGKETFYTEWLGADKISKIIIPKKMGLREALCLLSSDYTKLIFGPCTGLIHCAGGIYNNFVRNGMPAALVPPIVTYTGKYGEGHTAAYWWNTAPLVNVLILRATADHQKEVVLLRDLSEEEKEDTTSLLYCSEYTFDLLIDYLPSYSQSMVI